MSAQFCPICNRADCGCRTMRDGVQCFGAPALDLNNWRCVSVIPVENGRSCRVYKPVDSDPDQSDTNKYNEVDGIVPTDSLPEAGPPWQTITELGKLPAYREGLPAVTTGYCALDNVLRGGFRPQSLYFVSGRTGSAKSTLALNITRKAALSGCSVLVFKLEESTLEALWRIHAAAAQVDFLRLLDGAKRATPDERTKLEDGWNLIRELPIRFNDERDIDGLERISTLYIESGGQLIVIDQLSMISAPGLPVGYERATEISGRLRSLARRLHVPIVLVSQVGREASKKKDRLTCNDLRDSGALENDAAAVLLIDKARMPDSKRWQTDPMTLEIIVGKNRYGQVTRPDDPPLELCWWPRYGRIEDAARLCKGVA